MPTRLSAPYDSDCGCQQHHSARRGSLDGLQPCIKSVQLTSVGGFESVSAASIEAMCPRRAQIALPLR
jgi:hypothetical protein